jgi:DNA-binding HxlR family transcriptional regulator
MRTYGENCGLARALELVGERWALLVVRELLPGPKRFTDLARGMPRIPSNVLAGRLKEMEAAGILERRTVPRPGAGVVYELTEYGRELDGVLLALARWGARARTDEPASAMPGACSLVLGLRAAFRPGTDVSGTYEIHVGDTVVHARVEGGEVTVGEGPASDADVTVRTDLRLGAVIAGELSPDAADAGLSGDARLWRRFPEVFSFAT